MSAADKTKTRKSAHNPQHESGSWRSKRLTNGAEKKYSRQQLLRIYRPSKLPKLNQSEELHLLLSRQSLPPVHRSDAHFSHTLGADVNARKPAPRERKPEPTPEWYDSEMPDESQLPLPPEKPSLQYDPSSTHTEENKSPDSVKFTLRAAANIKNLPQGLEVLSQDLPADEVDYSKIDEEYEARIKKAYDEEEEQAPEWDEPTPAPVPPTEKPQPKAQELPPNLPKYPAQLLHNEAKEGNPFALTILESGVVDAQGIVTVLPSTKPFERVWYYKDPQGSIQGPFCTLEMFNWNIAGYFNPELLISLASKTYFVPLKLFMLQQKKMIMGMQVFQEKQASEHSPAPNPQTTNPQNCEEATSKLKSLLGLIK
jgi:hypothetical protein